MYVYMNLYSCTLIKVWNPTLEAHPMYTCIYFRLPYGVYALFNVHVI